MLGWLERNRFLVLALAVIGLLAAVAVSGVTGSERRDPLVFRSADEAPPGSPIRVHVAGAVARPGLYDLLAGDRVADAVALAAGPLDNANLDALNLARHLRDGEQILVPTRVVATATRVATLVAGARLDLNSATEAQLDLLPNIGATLARRIVDSRKVDGPFRRPEDLVDRNVLPRGTFEKVRDLIVVVP